MTIFKRVRTSAIFREYITVFILLLVISFTIFGASLSVFVKNYWEDEKINLLAENAERISESVVQLVGSDYAQRYPSNTALIICNNLVTASEAISADFFICDMNGNVIYCQEMRRSDMNLFTGDCIIHRKISIPQKIIESLQNEPYSGISTLEETVSENNFIYMTPIQMNDTDVGIVVGMQPVSASFRPYILSLFQMFLLSVLFTLVIAFIAIYLMSYELTKPLRQMSEATKSYANGDFSKRITVRGNNEVAELASAFNVMAKALASLESSRRSFVANVSHELKTPMTTIGGFIDGILDGTISDDKHNYYLSIVSDEVKRLSRLVTGMLNMSKIEAGELGLNYSDFDISEMIFRITLGFEQIIESRRLKITGLENMKPTVISGDEDMLTQVVYNLIDNAVKFTPDDGEIHFDVVNDLKNVYVSIRNTGKGISTDEIQKVFERFYKVDKSRSFDTKGAGLGLYLVKSIVEMHGGRVKASSVENQYTEFSFLIPTQKQ